MLSLIVRFCTKYMSIGVVLIGIFIIFRTAPPFRISHF